MPSSMLDKKCEQLAKELALVTRDPDDCKITNIRWHDYGNTLSLVISDCGIQETVWFTRGDIASYWLMRGGREKPPA